MSDSEEIGAKCDSATGVRHGCDVAPRATATGQRAPLKGALPPSHSSPVELFPEQDPKPSDRQTRHQSASKPVAPVALSREGLDPARILALDLGSKCGYAYGDPVSPSRSGVFDLTPKRFEGGGMRYLRFQRHLEELAPSIVFFEEVRRHLGTDAAHIYGGLLAHLQAFCEQRSIPYSGIPVQHVKKRATGKGNAPKELVRDAARTAFNFPTLASFDQADALWILQLGLETIRGR